MLKFVLHSEENGTPNVNDQTKSSGVTELKAKISQKDKEVNNLKDAS